MKAIINFPEIHSLVKSRTGREVVLSAISERTVRAEAKVSVKVPLFGEIEKTIGVEVTMERIDGQDVYLRYDGGMGTDMIIGGLLTFLSSTPAKSMVEKVRGNEVVVHLNEIEEARKALAIVELTGITFQDEGVVVDGKFKLS